MPAPAFVVLLVLGLAALLRSIAVEDGASFVLSLVFIALVIGAGDYKVRKRNRSASVDLSALNRDGERIGWDRRAA